MPAQERKRPWYLVLALPAALALGMMGACNGWQTVTYYRVTIEPASIAAGIPDEEDRAAVESRYEGYVQALDAAKVRGWPLAVGTFLLGSALVFFAMRAMGGSRSARVALVQLALAQAGLTGVSYWLMRDVDSAELRWQEALAFSARGHDGILPKPPADDYTVAFADKVAHALNPVRLALKTLGSALVVIALTRRGSRDFFDAAGAAIEER
jgi:hypothetical protein